MSLVVSYNHSVFFPTTFIRLMVCTTYGSGSKNITHPLSRGPFIRVIMRHVICVWFRYTPGSFIVGSGIQIFSQCIRVCRFLCNFPFCRSIFWAGPMLKQFFIHPSLFRNSTLGHVKPCRILLLLTAKRKTSMYQIHKMCSPKNSKFLFSWKMSD